MAPLLAYDTCFSDDCLRYYAYLEGYLDTPEPMFQIANTMHDLGLPTFFTIKLLSWVIPIVFSLGLWILMKDRFGKDRALMAILFVNASVCFNLFWFVLLKNAMMIMFFPFFMHFFLDEKYAKSLFFLACMALSHMTFALLIAPVILYSAWYGGLNKFNISAAIISVLFLIYYLMSPQAAIVGRAGGANLNYFFVDLFLLALAVTGENDSVKWMFVFLGGVSLGSAFLLRESWRFMIMLNVPTLLATIGVLKARRSRSLENVTLLYFAAMLPMLAYYALTLQPYL